MSRSLAPILALAIGLAAPAMADDAPDETAIFDALKAHLETHKESTQAGFYPDGTPLEPFCEEFGHTVCVADAFIRAHDTGAAITAAEALEADRRVILDVRGDEEREWIALGDAADHAVRFGDHVWDPMVIGPLDREMFADEALAALGGLDQPVAVLCSAGVRSRAAAMALREAGFTDVANIADGVIGGPAGPGMAAALGIEIPPPPSAEQGAE